MEIKDIKDLILTMDKTSIEKVDIENNGFKISISKNIKVEKSNNEIVYAQPNVVEETIKIQEQVPVQKETIELNAVPQENTEDYKDMFVVKSPIVGTFYSSPSPDADNFVKIGDRVKEGQTLCIIEAMKIMNQIESEISGEIFEILVENEDIVEYNQPLMIIRR